MSYKYENEIKNAIHLFWQTKTNQLAHSTDKSNRGAVTGGKQLDGFIVILKKLALSAGVKRNCIFTKNNYLPGYFRGLYKGSYIHLTRHNSLL